MLWLVRQRHTVERFVVVDVPDDAEGDPAALALTAAAEDEGAWRDSPLGEDVQLLSPRQVTQAEAAALDPEWGRWQAAAGASMVAVAARQEARGAFIDMESGVHMTQREGGKFWPSTPAMEVAWNFTRSPVSAHVVDVDAEGVYVRAVNKGVERFFRIMERMQGAVVMAEEVGEMEGRMTLGSPRASQSPSDLAGELRRVVMGGGRLMSNEEEAEATLA